MGCYIWEVEKGIASKEAVVMNVFKPEELGEIYDIPYTEIKTELGKDITREQLAVFDNKGYTGFLVDIHETLTGAHYRLRNLLLQLLDSYSSLCYISFK